MLAKRIACIGSSAGLFLGLFSASAFAVDWSWQLERSSLYESVVSIKQGKESLFEQEFSCDLSDALLQKTDDSTATVEVVVTKSKPKGVLIVTCAVGAHSERIVVLDPFKIEGKKVYEATGSYFADWALQEDGRIMIRYDKPCEDKGDEVCEIPFSTVEPLWP